MTTTAPPRSKKRAPNPVGRKRSEQPVMIAGEPYYARLKRLIDSRRGDRSYAKVAESIGMDRRMISRILSGKVPDPQLSTLVALLDAVGANLCHLHRAEEKIPD